MTSDSEFERWLRDLRFEASQVYSNFEVVAEDWRDNFDAGVPAAVAFWRVMDAVFEPTAEELLAFETRRGATLQ